ncbi:member of the karyopherin-beta family [Scheffersomyces coipomensis]|uniref:member of the karyopherin-beta family n=1 Tax=Scheffersomyces coipomensis TaxID=1788519 RepID=UPI00315DBEC7
MNNDWNIETVVSSIELVYSTNDTDKIKQVQEYLQSIQKSSTGYQLGQVLIKQPSKYCRYFGALTFTVFLNTYQDSITSDQITSIFDELLDYVISLSQESLESNLFIIKKLLSTLSLLFIDHNQTGIDNDVLINPIQRYFYKLGNPNIIISELNDSQLKLLIYFHTIIVEDIRKRDNSKLSQTHEIIYKYLFPNLKHIFGLLDSNQHQQQEIHELALDCLFAWFTYIGIAEHGSKVSYTVDPQILQPLIQYTFYNLKFDDLENRIAIVSKTCTVLSQILEEHPLILNPYKTLLAQILFEENSFGSKFLHAILSNKDLIDIYQQEIENFTDLIIAYLNLNLVYIIRNLTNPQVLRILDIAVTLTNFPGRPIEDEKLSDQFLVFWEEFINMFIEDTDVINEIFKEDTVSKQKYFEIRNEILINISIIYWKKCHIFSDKIVPEFRHYRSKVAEVFQLLYSLLNTSIYSTLCKNVIDTLVAFQNTPNQELSLDIEASLFLLFKVTDDLTFYDDESTQILIPYLEEIFQHKVIETIDENFKNNQINITLLNLLSSLPFFFKSRSGEQYITTTFNYLFSIIIEQQQQPQKQQTGVSLISSKTILKICQNSRSKLTQFLPQLENIVVEMIRNIEFDSLIRERLVNSFMSIAQSLKDPLKLGEVVIHLLNQINQQIELVVHNPNQLLTSPDSTKEENDQKMEDYTVSLLGCINEIGNATKLPEELEDYLTVEQKYQTESYWNEDTLGVKQAILQSINQLSLNYPPLSLKTLPTEKCCNIFKCGLNEPINGPFKFELAIIFQYLMVKVQNCNSGSMSLVYKLVESIIITNGKHVSIPIFESFLSSAFLNKLTFIEQDVDLIKSSLDLFSTVLEKHPSLIVNLPSFQNVVLKFAISSFKFKESYIIRSVIKFWNTLITLKRGQSSEQQLIQDLIVKEHIIDPSHPLGYSLVLSLITSFIDNPRSNTEYFYQLFRVLVAKYPLYIKNWLRVILIHKLVDNSTNDKFNNAFVDTFVSKLMLTRGQRQANDVLKSFWLDCNNLVEYKS